MALSSFHVSPEDFYLLRCSVKYFLHFFFDHSNQVSYFSFISSTFLDFSSLTEIIKHLRIVLPRLFKDVFDSIGPCVVDLINVSNMRLCSLSSKREILIPPFSRITGQSLNFLSYQRFQRSQFITSLDLNCISEKFQSGFKRFHSTETTRLRVFNDFMSVDCGSSAVLVLLDLTSAFDTVHHQILLSRLDTCWHQRCSSLALHHLK